jgi:hypothetical protein
MADPRRPTRKLARIEPPSFSLTPGLVPFVEQLKKSSDPRDQVLAQLAASSDINRQETQWQTPLLIETHYQARTTNGRVGRLEALQRVGKIVGLTLIAVFAGFSVLFPNKLAPLAELITKLLFGG